MVSIVRKHLTSGAGSSLQGKLSLLGFIFIPIYLAISLASSLIPPGIIAALGTSGCTGQEAVLGADGSESCQVAGVNVLQLIAMLMAVISAAALIAAHKNNDWIPVIEDTRVGAITTEEVRGFMRTIPTIVCVVIGFNLCYGGMDVYQIQACQMDTRTGFPSWLDSFFLLKTQFNGVFFSLGNNASIIVCIPLFEKVIFPCIKSMRRGKPVSRNMKYNAGFFFAICGCLIGVAIEIARKNADFVRCPGDLESQVKEGLCFCATIGDHETFRVIMDPKATISAEITACSAAQGEWLLVPACAPGGVPMSDISAWWTFIPYWVTGMGEILVNPVIQEFAFVEVSPNLKSLLMGLTLVVMGCIPAVVEGSLTGFIPNDLNKGDVNIVFFIFIVLSLILLAVYHMIALPDKVRAVGEPALLEQES